VSVQRHRVEWLYAARGIAIVLVVAGHVERGLVAGGRADGVFWTWFDFTIYSFHMPLFFLLAGLNVPSSLARGKAYFIKRKAWTIAYPYVLWSLLQGSLIVLMAPSANQPLTWQALATIGWRPISQFWFLYALLVYQAVILIVGVKPWPLLIGAVLGFAAAGLYPPASLPQVLLQNFPFFVAGILLAGDLLAEKPRPNGFLIGALFAAFGIAVMLTGEEGRTSANALVVLPATVLGIAMVLWAARYLDGKILGVARAIGRASMTIYVLHILMAAGVRMLLLKAGMPLGPGLYFLVLAAAGLGIPLLAHYAMERWKILPFLGLAYWPRQPDAARAIGLPGGRQDGQTVYVRD
jgi:fucose 4-O-acetylase-like acetyltransferase